MNNTVKVNLNELVERFYSIKKEIELSGDDPILEDIYFDHLDLLKSKYGQVLNDILFQIHYCNCDDDCIQSPERYISDEGVTIKSKGSVGTKSKLKLKANPLRFITTDTHRQNEITLWQAA